MHLKNEWKVLIECFIKRARHLNEFGKKSASHPLPGTDFLYDMLRDKVFDNSMYQQLKQLAEDSTLEYEIIIK